MTPDERIFARQRERIEELEEEVLQLRELLKPKRIFPLEWKLQPSQQRLLSAMLDAPGGYIQIDHASNIISKNTEGVDINTVRVRISQMRKNLGGLGISIVSRWGGGYELTGPSKSIIRAAIEKRMAE